MTSSHAIAATTRDGRPLRVLVAHPSPELYGSDRQLLESVAGLREAGCAVLVTVPEDGPLLPELAALGAEVRVLDVPVLRKSLMSPRGLLDVAARSARSGPARRLLRSFAPDVVYVNTVTVPLWLAVARTARVPAVCHVHEAEDLALPVRLALASPLLLARSVLVNSRAAADVLERTLPPLRHRLRLLYNGVPGPSSPPAPLPESAPTPLRLVQVGRLSPRKGPDVAVRAVRRLVDDGHDVTLDLVGSPPAGYEDFDAALRAEAAPLGDRVRFLGFRPDVWPALADAHVALVASRLEPFGNVAVEALHAGRALVASRTQGLVEVVQDGRTGLLVPPDDPDALADAVARLATDWPLARQLADAGRADAAARFSPARYRQEVVAEVARVAARRRA